MKSIHLRKLSLILSMLFFPVTLYYFSPALVINAGLEGVINGSFIVFVTLFITSLFFGRIFCAYLCPAGGLQECLFAVKNTPTVEGPKYYIKYVVWFFWMIALILCYVFGKGVNSVDFFYETQQGISATNRESYILYYGIIILILLPSLIGGKRGFCHYFCWMAPFMVLGRKVGRVLHLPAIKIFSNGEKCIDCKLCNKNCPMSIDVASQVQKGIITHPECIQCGECIQGCPKNVLSFRK